MPLCQPLTPSRAPEATRPSSPPPPSTCPLLYWKSFPVGTELKAEKEEKVEDREGQLQGEREREQETQEGTDHGGNLRWRETGQGGLSDSRKSLSFRVTIPFCTTEMGQDLAWDHRMVRGSARAPGHTGFSLNEEGGMEEHSPGRISQREAAGPWRASASSNPNRRPPSAGIGGGELLPEGLPG